MTTFFRLHVWHIPGTPFTLSAMNMHILLLGVVIPWPRRNLTTGRREWSAAIGNWWLSIDRERPSKPQTSVSRVDEDDFQYRHLDTLFRTRASEAPAPVVAVLKRDPGVQWFDDSNPFRRYPR